MLPKVRRTKLYRNLYGEQFINVTTTSQINETSYSQGVAAGDYDNDGSPTSTSPTLETIVCSEIMVTELTRMSRRQRV